MKKTRYKLYVFYDLNGNGERKVDFKKAQKEMCQNNNRGSFQVKETIDEYFLLLLSLIIFSTFETFYNENVVFL